jgi:hypothetical protein
MPTRHERKINVKAAAAYTGMSTQQVHRAFKVKRLRGYSAGEFGPVYYTRTDLDAWLDSMSNVPAEESTPAPRTDRRSARAGAR